MKPTGGSSILMVAKKRPYVNILGCILRFFSLILRKFTKNLSYETNYGYILRFIFLFVGEYPISLSYETNGVFCDLFSFF
jgi:hypothetical protein